MTTKALDRLMPAARAGALCLLLLAACAAPAPDSATAASGVRAGYAVADPPAPLRHPLEDRGYDALHYRIDVEIPYDRPSFRGAEQLRLRATAPLRTVVLDACDMSVTAVTADTRVAEFTHDQRLLTVTLPRPLGVGDETILRIQYQVARPIAGMHFSLPSESGVADAMPELFTQGEDIRARYWFPCFDAPHERATHEVVATVPLSWQVIAGGKLISREVNAVAGTATVTWRLDREMPCYLFTLAAGPFVTVPDQWEDVPIAHYVEPQDLNDARATFARTPDVLGFFSEYTGFRYPFAKYAHVAVRDFPFGGMENASATTVTRGAVRPASEAPEGAWGLVAHEAAHQWFGDTVTCESWPHAWLNEGFATYFTNLYQRHAFGEQAFLYGMGGTMDGYLAACQGPNLRAVVKEEYRLPMDLFFDGTIYPGGASRLQLLRGVLGEADFRKGLKIYLERNAFRSVATSAFAAAMSEASGQDLSAWFAQWVYAPGYPMLDVRWSLDANGDARVDLRQTQGADGGVPAAFRFPLEIAWSEGGAAKLRRFEVDAREHSWTLDLGANFDGFLEFDPQVWVPARWTIHEDATATLRRAAHAGSARVRALACRDLAATGGPAAQAALLAAAQRDPVPGVRAEAAGLVGPLLGPTEARTALDAYAAERDPGARESWWRQLERFATQPAVAEAMARKLADPRGTAAERQSALRGLASLRHGDDLRGFLAGHALDEAEDPQVRSAAIGMLAQKLPDAATRSTLLPLSWSGNATEIRTAALRALRPWLDQAQEDDPAAMSVVDAYRKALQSLSAQLRSAAADGAGAHPQWFRPEIADLLRREPDTRIRRQLEGGSR